jgi:hypothetical protein
LLLTFVLALAFLAATAQPATYELLDTLYAVATVVLVVGFNWMEGSRLRSFLKA